MNHFEKELIKDVCKYEHLEDIKNYNDCLMAAKS